MMNLHGSSAAAFTSLQLCASTARRETKSDTPDAQPLRQAPLEALASAVESLVPAGRAQALAAALEGCLDGNALRLSRLDAEWSRLACRLPPAAWSALDGLAGNGGIKQVDVPQADHGDDLAPLAEGLATLPSLDALTLPVPRHGDDIDLSGLSGCRRPLALRLNCVRGAAWQVTVPRGCRVQAVGSMAGQHQLLKPKVTYVDGDGQPTGESHALPGVPYMAKPPQSILEACQGDAKAARQAALDLCMNGRAKFEDQGADGKGTPSTAGHVDRTIWCRHIAWKVGEDWRVRRGLQQVGMPVAMSYEPYSTPEALSAHIEPETQALYERDLAREAVAVFTDQGFGQALEAQFNRLQEGEERIFLLITMNHAIAFELRRKGGHCIVTRYDPNASALPLKLLVSDPSHLRGYSLGDLLGSRHRLYVPVGAFVAGSLFASGPDSERGSEPCLLHGFTDDVMASREGLFWLLRSGATAAIDRSVEAIVASQASKDLYLLVGRLSAVNQGYSGLADARFWRRQQTVAAYVQSIRRHALPVVGQEGVDLLLKDIPTPEDSSTDGKDRSGSSQ